MTLGLAPRQGDLLDDLNGFCGETLPPDSIYALLHRERDRLFPDEMFADLFTDRGRRSVPPSVVAVVMVLQRLEGLSDREATERFTFDARWRYAAGVGGYEGKGRCRFVHTVLVDMRERLRHSSDPDRVFKVTVAAARKAGLVGRRRVLDSTALYDAVSTMDTVTLIRSAVRGLLGAADQELATELRGAIAGDDDYCSAAKPQIDWDDPAAREALVDSRAKDAIACLEALEGRIVSALVSQAAVLLATVVGQDLEAGPGGVLGIAQGVTPDRIISTVDPDARHGRKTRAHGFDGYKAHVAIDPDSEIVTAAAVSPANVGDAAVAEELLADVLATQDEAPVTTTEEPAAVYADSAYGTGDLLEQMQRKGITAMIKVQPPAAPAGHFSKEEFAIDLDAGTATCPAGVTVPLRPRRGGASVAVFGDACASCALVARCTDSAAGRVVNVGPHEALLSAARERRRDPDWAADYRATRPKVERKIGHLMRRRHGGRRARVRGIVRVAQDFAWLAAAVNLGRMAVLGAG
jgi:hypothetical protein